MRSSPVLALDVGASRLTCAVLTVGKGRVLRLEEVATEPIGSAVKESQWPDEVNRVVRVLAARVAHLGEVRVAVPGHLGFTKCVRTPVIAGAKQRRVVEFEATQNIPHPLDVVWWDHAVLDERPPDLEILLMAGRLGAMVPLCAAMGPEGWKLQVVRPTTVALPNAFRLNYPDVIEPVLLVSVGARSTHLLVCSQKRLWPRTVGLGGNAVTQAIAKQLNVDFTRAEAVKRAATAGDPEVSTAERAAFDSAIVQFSGRLQLEIARTLTGFGLYRPGENVGQIFMTGGGTRLPALGHLLRERVGLPVARFNPLRRVSCGPSGTVSPEAEAGVAVGVGLAADLVVTNSVAGNLRPRGVRVIGPPPPRRPWWLVAAALFAVGLLPLTWHFHQNAVAAEATLRQRQAEIRAARALAQRNADNAARLDEVQGELATLTTLKDARSYWVSFLSDLQARLGTVEDVWLDELAVAANPGGENGPHPDSGDGGLRLVLSGRLLDVKHPQAKTSEESFGRAKTLLASLAASPFVVALEAERFDDPQPAVLRFSCQLTTKPPGGSAPR